MTVHFISHLGEDATVVDVDATVTQSSGMDDTGYGAGLIVEDMVVRDHFTQREVGVTKREREWLEETAARLARESS